MANSAFTSAEIDSSDGTRIGVHTTGSGPGVVVLPGTLRGAKHYRELASGLASDFTVHVVDRRGRGTSGPQGENYGIDAECADLASVLTKTGASLVFGHSFGALVALEAPFRQPEVRIDRLALYEPPLSIDGRLNLTWLPDMDTAVAEGRTTDAVTIMMSGLDMDGPIKQFPLHLRQVVAKMALRGDLLRDVEEILPTVHGEVVIVAELDSPGDRYAGLAIRTLLLGGERSPGYLRDVIGMLHAGMPDSTVVTQPKAGHNAPDLEAPREVAAHLRTFFST